MYDYRGRLELRDYQRGPVAEVRSALAADGLPVLLAGGTGVGKTKMAAGVILPYLDEGKTVAFAVDMRSLLQQTVASMAECGIEVRSIFGGGGRFRADKRFHLVSAQAVTARRPLPGVDLLVVDEAHVMYAEIERTINERPDMHVLGLSATPYTEAVRRVFRRLVSTPPSAQIEKMGGVVPLKVFVPAEQIDTRGLRRTAGELNHKEVGERAIRLRGAFVPRWLEIVTAQFGAPRKTLAFTASIEQSHAVADEFTAAGHRFEVISAETSNAEREAILKRFTSGETIGLASCAALSKGFDVPDAAVAILMRPFFSSMAAHQQQVGRVVRPATGKAFGVVIDHCGNWLRFADRYWHVYEHGPEDLFRAGEVQSDEVSEAQRKAATCHACGAVMPPGAGVCGECGAERAGVEIEHQDAEMIEVIRPTYDMPLLAPSAKTPAEWWASLLTFADLHGLNKEASRHLFELRFKMRPDRFPDELGPIRPNVFNMTRAMLAGMRCPVPDLLAPGALARHLAQKK